MIEISNLTKDYGNRRAISDLSFSVKKGEVVGFLGPNGAGKTTTMKIITGFMAATRGNAFVDGLDVFEHPIEVKKKIGYLPEITPVYEDMKVEDYVVFVARLQGVKESEVLESSLLAMEKLGLMEEKNRFIGHLSKGFRQRVGFAGALVSNPEILILDEPTAGLDPKQVSAVRDLIQTLKKDHTIILSTHILSEVEALCERIIIINKGKIVAEDTIENLRKRLSKGQCELSIRVRRSEDKARDIISSLKGVAQVSFSEGFLRVLVENDQDRLEEISKAVVDSGSGLVEFHAKHEGLENIFIELTS